MLPLSDYAQPLLGVVFETLRIGIVVLDDAGRILDVNPALLTLVNKLRSELVEKGIDAIVACGSEASATTLGDLQSGAKREGTIEGRLMVGGGDGRWARVKLSRSAGELPIIVGVVDDISEARERDKHAHATAHALGERVKELTALHGTAALLLEIRDVTDLRLDAVAALLPPAMQYPKVTTGCIRYGHRTFATPGHAPTPWILSSSFHTSDGVAGSIEVAYHQEMPASAVGPFLAEEVALLNSLCDMLRAALDRSLAERAIQRSNERFNLALEAANTGIWEWDLTDNSTRWSAQLSKMLMLDETDVQGVFRGYEHVVHPSDRARLWEQLAQAAQGAGELAGLEVRMQRSDGRYRTFAATSRTVRTPPARATRIVVALVDITERRALEEGLRQAQKFEALAAVAGGVAHDFNNLMTVLLCGTEILAERAPADEVTRELVTDLRHTATSGATLARQLLTFSRRGTFQPAVIDVGALIRRAQPMLKRIVGKSIQLAVRSDLPDGELWADPVELEQAVLNLVVNARDAMPQGGTVTVSLQRCAHTHDEDIKSASGFAVIEVEDSGTGIAPEVLPRIFEPFFTTKEPGKGTGLGLAVVSSVVRRWSGSVQVDSELGKGTRFRMYLPLLPAHGLPGSQGPELERG